MGYTRRRPRTTGHHGDIVRRTLEPQDQISRYSVVGPLGAGGMGEVYVAKDESLDRHVALKVLPPHLVRNEERVRRFIIEAKSASSLNHPNIVTIYEIGQDRVRVSGAGAGGDEPVSDPVHYISMELVTGETLGQKIHEEKTDLRTLLGYLAQAAEGIAKAHAAGIVHRDLKPGNIMVSKDGFAKVLDFGLAKLTERQSELPPDATSAPTAAPATGEGVIMGTAGYMSPEQVQGKSVDTRSDIFSMGCILYEAATRRRPFVADSDVEIMHKILRDRPTPVEEINPQIPVDVRRIIRRCLAKSPDQRFQSMKDLAIELREAYDEYDSLPVSGPSGSSVSSASSHSVSSASSPAVSPSSSPGLGAARPARGRLLAVIVAVAVLCAAGIAGAYLYMGRRAAPGRDGGRGGEGGGLDMKMSVLMSRDDIKESVLSGDGRYLAYVTSAEEKTSLNVRQVRTGSDVRILSPQEFAVHGVSFSPDGDYLYYLNQDPVSPNYQALFQVPSLGGTPRKIFFDVDTAACFSPDGSRLCFRRGKPDVKSDTLVIGDLQTGKDRELVRVAIPKSFSSAPSWSPDGKQVAVALQTPEGGLQCSISVIDVESGRETTIQPKPISFFFMGSIAWLPGGDALIVSGNLVGSPTSQIFRIAYPGGETRRLTNDLNGYAGLSLASAGRSIAAMRGTDVTNVWMAPADGGEAHPVTTATGSSASAQNPVPLPGGGVAFGLAEGERVYLARAAADGSDRRSLVAQGLFNFGAFFSEKTGVLFSEVSEVDRIIHIWRVDPDGGGLRQLTQGKGEILDDLSRDGGIAIFSRVDDPATVWSLNPVAGGEPKRLASNTTGDPGSISPDGRLIRYSDFTTVQGRIYGRSNVIPSGGGALVAQLRLPPGAMAWKWSPDSKALTYVDRNKGWNLLNQPLAGGEPVVLTRFTEGVTTGFEWSPDGARMAVVRKIGQKAGLWSVASGKGEARLLTEFRTGAISDLRWTPDSKSVFFVYGTSSKDIVLISDFQ